MDFPFSQLKELVRSVVTRKNVSRVAMTFMRQFEPLIKRIEKGVYPLAPAHTIHAEHVAKAIEGAIGRPVSDVVFVSEACPLPKPEWMTEENYRHICRHTDIRQNLRDTLASCLRERSEYDGDDIPFANIGVGLVADISGSLSHSRLASIGACVFFFGRAVVFGDRGDLERLGKLLEILPHSIPLGEKKDQDGVWLVLCA